MSITIERRILELLAANSDLTSAELGDAVGLSASAVHRRVAQLRESGAITGYRAVLSQTARGDPSIVLVNVTLRDQRKGNDGGVRGRDRRVSAGCPMLPDERGGGLHAPRRDPSRRDV
ncbi:winged helix-turn-helix transcriptional regulator [Sphingomonas sp. H160509]|uniref:winged helix-turn-helix transcriptional regulator n=1 Tax=Sphingomonas sp. H160509 TaxID=2955313 RepID=UPI003158B1CC